MRQIFLAFIVLLSMVPSAYAQEDLLSRLDKATGVTLPDGYGKKVADFVRTNFVMQNKDALAFTEQFIVEKMKEDWGINRQNQLLFVWYAIHDNVVGEDLYDGEDGNDARLEDFETAVENVDACGEAFFDGFMVWMMARCDEYDRQSAEYQRQSAEYEKQSAEYEKQIAKAEQEILQSLKLSISGIMIFYDTYLIDPDKESVESRERLSKFRGKVQDVYGIAKKYNFDYKAEILKAVGGDEKMAKDIFKLFGIE